MNSNLAYEIGGVFLLCALLMFGTRSGHARKFRYGKGALIGIVVALLGWTLYRYSPELMALLPAPAASSVADKPAAKTAPAPALRAKPAAQAAQQWRTVIVEPAAAPEVAEPVKIEAAPEPAAANTPASAPLVRDGPDPYESGVKRAAKGVGRFLHLGHREK